LNQQKSQRAQILTAKKTTKSPKFNYKNDQSSSPPKNLKTLNSTAPDNFKNAKVSATKYLKFKIHRNL
jgi:hypothetical protein